jgi:hypothetical protein
MRISIVTTSVLASMLLFALIANCSFGNPSLPSPDDEGAWRWVAAESGANVYVDPRIQLNSDSTAGAWVDRSYFDNPSGISTHVTEFRVFDCLKHATRTLSRLEPLKRVHERASFAVTPSLTRWHTVARGTAAEHVLSFVCTKMTLSAHPDTRRGST